MWRSRPPHFSSSDQRQGLLHHRLAAKSLVIDDVIENLNLKNVFIISDDPEPICDYHQHVAPQRHNGIPCRGSWGYDHHERRRIMTTHAVQPGIKVATMDH